MPRQERADEPAAPNQPPQITITPAQVVEAQSTWIYEITASDPDDGPQPLAVTLAAPPIPQTPEVTFTAHPVSGNMVIQWTPAAELVGQTLWFDVRVSDGAAVARQNIPVTVHPANSAPVVAAIADRTVTAGTSLALTVSASDPNGDPLSFQLDPDSLARGMTISSTGQVAWNPGAEHLAASPYTVTVSVSDGRADAVTRSFQVSVVADTTPPAVGLYAWRRGDWLESGSGIPWYPPLEEAAVKGRQCAALAGARLVLCGKVIVPGLVSGGNLDLVNRNGCHHMHRTRVVRDYVRRHPATVQGVQAWTIVFADRWLVRVG